MTDYFRANLSASSTACRNEDKDDSGKKKKRKSVVKQAKSELI